MAHDLDLLYKDNVLKNIKPKQCQFARFLAQGSTIIKAARDCGIHEVTAHRWLKLSHVQLMLKAYIQSDTPINVVVAEARDSYVYTFAYPDGTIFYVGKGTGERIRDHFSMALSKKRKSITPVATVMRSIWQQGGKVFVRKPYRNLTNNEALQMESELITRYGYEQLVNEPPTIEGRIQKRLRRAQFEIEGMP